MRIFASAKLRAFPLLFSLTFSVPALAQSDRAALDGYLEAMTRLDFKKGAEFFAESDCQQFKALLKPILEVANGAEMRDTAQRAFGDLLVPANFEAMAPCKLVADLLTRILAMNASLGAATTFSAPTVLGVVPEGEDMRDFIIRSRATVGGEPVGTVQVVTVSRVGTDWRVRMSERLAGMASLMPRLLIQQKMMSGASPPARPTPPTPPTAPSPPTPPTSPTPPKSK